MQIKKISFRKRFLFERKGLAALKKVVVITGICFMLFMAFFSAYHVFATSSLNFYGGAGYNNGTGVSCTATGGAGDAGSFCSVSFQTAGAVGSGNTVVAFTGSTFYTSTSSFVQVSGPSPTIVSDGISTYSTSGWSSASTRTATLSAHNGDLLLAIATGAGASNFGTAFISGDSQSLSWTPTSGSTAGNCVGGPPCTPVLAQVYFWFAYATATGSESVTMSSTTTNGMAGGLVVYDISGSTSVTTGSGGCAPAGPYACSTTSTVLTYTNATCVAGSSGTCTQTTTFTIINWDDTSANITNIIYCDHESGCANYTKTTTATAVYTDVSVSPTTTTKTTTVTNTALNSPSGFSLQFWLVPLIFLMGPAFGFMGAYGSVTRERGGNVASNTALLFFLLGLNLGAIGGIILKVMPFPVLVLTFIPLVLLLYSMR